MRPGQLTPENVRKRSGLKFKWNRFNEAGAINPGKRLDLDPYDNEFTASMRPGQLTPENAAALGGPPPECRSFNEAGAINPGKQLLVLSVCLEV